MTRLDRYKQQLEGLYVRYRKLNAQGKFAVAASLMHEIRQVEERIKEAEEYEDRFKPKPISQLLTHEQVQESGILPMIMECHLAADFLTDCAFNLRSKIKELGFNPVNLIPDIDDIVKKSEVFASILCKRNQRLSRMMTDNERLLADMHMRTLRHICECTGEAKVDGLEPKTGREKNVWNEERLAEFSELWNKGVSVADIARHYGLKPSTVRNKANNLGLGGRELPARSIISDPEKKRFLIKNYPIMSNETLAIYFNCSCSWLRTVARRLGLRKSREFMEEQNESRRMKARERAAASASATATA